MKRLSVFLLTVLVALAASAWGRARHFKFNGAAIDGTMESFIGSKPFKRYQVQERSAFSTLLTGPFAGRQCRVLVERLPDEDCVWGLTVMLPSRDDWRGLLADYREFTAQCAKQYGSPVASSESFIGYNDPENDRLRFWYVQEGICSYKSVYETDEGQVDVVIWHDSTNGCYVLLSFIDKSNSQRQFLADGGK